MSSYLLISDENNKVLAQFSKRRAALIVKERLDKEKGISARIVKE